MVMAIVAVAALTSYWIGLPLLVVAAVFAWLVLE